MVDILSNEPDPQKQMIALISARQEVRGKMMLTSSVIDNLVDLGYISEDDAKDLKKVSFNGKAPYSKAKAKKPKKIAIQKLKAPKKVKVGRYKPRKIKLQTVKSAKIKPLKVKPLTVDVKKYL